MYKYHLRIQLSPTLDFQERLENLIDFCKKSKIDDVMFFVGCEELNTGHITVSEAKKYVDVISNASKILKEIGVTVSLNPWMTLGHYDGAKTFKAGQNFRGMVGHDGTKAKLCVCPLCKEWRKYYVELLNFYIDTLAPDTLWLEDDFRLFRHGAEKSISVACFCDEHMRIYNERLGKTYDRESLVNLIYEDFEVRKVFLDVCRETMEETLAYIVKNTKEQKRFGLMTGGINVGEARRFSILFDILSEKKGEKPYNRLSPCAPRQISPQQTGQLFNRIALLNRYLTGNTADCVTEIENNPHTLYTKSVRYNKFQQLNAIPALLTGTTFSIFEFNGNGAIDYERLAKMYAEIKPFLSRLQELELSPFDSIGVNILVNQDMPYRAKTEDWGSLQDYDAGYFAAWFELLGINCCYNTNLSVENEVIALSAQTIRSLTIAQIEKLFASNFVILNGDSVEALFELGLNGIIDAKSYVQYIERHSDHTFEEFNSNEKIKNLSRMRATNNWSSGNYLKIEYGDGRKKVYTNVMDYNEAVFGNGLTRVGNVLIEPHQEPNMVPFAIYHPLKEYVLKSAIKESSFFKDKMFFIQEENVAPYSFKKDGRIILMCVNFCDDDYEQITIETGKEYSDIKIITTSNVQERKPKIMYCNGKYTIFETLKGEESYVLIFSE